MERIKPWIQKKKKNGADKTLDTGEVTMEQIEPWIQKKKTTERIKPWIQEK